MGQAQVEQPVVDVAAIRRERRPAVGQPPDDDPERVDDRDAQDEQRDGDLRGAEDREHRERVADEHDAARADEDRAGWKFQRRNPSSAPASAKHSTAMNGCETVTVSEIRPRVSAAMRAMPDDSPSRPSMKLMLLIIPTIHSIVNPVANGPSSRIVPLPNGLLRYVIVMPAATASSATPSWPSSCHRARSW